MRQAIIGGLIGVVLVAVGANTVFAQRYQSDNYTIDASVGNSFGGNSSSANYDLVSSGGESIIGNGAGGSYMLGQGYIAQLETSLQLSVQPKGLAAYYPLEEAANDTARDDSINSNSLSVVNGPAMTEGMIGQGMSFDGVDDKLQTESNTLSDLSAASWSAWVKFADVDKDQMFLSKQSGNYLRILSGRLHGSFVYGGQKTLHGSTSLNADQWYHLAATAESGQMRLYVNGQPDAERTDLAGSLDFSTGLFQIGQWTDADKRSANATIDEVKIYSRGLSPVEVEAEYQAGLAGVPAGLVFPENIISGVSQTVEAEAMILTNTPGYAFNISQNNDLTSGSDTIPGVAGSIESPSTWNEGSTKGLGFTIYDLSTGTLPAKWQSGGAYAGLPSTATSAYTRSGFSGGSKDIIDIRYRIDVASNQPSEQYKNTVTYTGVIIP